VRVVKKFELGLNDYRLYRQGVISFYHVYEAFERTWSKLLANPAGVPPHIYAALQALADPRLSRTPQIAADLEYFYGAEGFDPKRAPDTPQRKAVVDYIEKNLTEKPHLLLAYAHIYYMALFAGGKILVRMMLAKKDFFPVHKPAGSYEEAQKFGTNMFLFPVDKGKEEGLRNKFKDAMCEVEGALTEAEKTG
jgi:heme oxygenase